MCWSPVTHHKSNLIAPVHCYMITNMYKKKCLVKVSQIYVLLPTNHVTLFYIIICTCSISLMTYQN